MTAPLKSPVIKSEECGAIGQGTQRSTAAVKAPPKSPVVKTEASETAVLPPNPSEAAVAPRASVASVSTQTQLLLGRPAVQHEPPNLRPVTMAPPPQLLASNVHSHTAQPRLSPRSFGSSSTQNPASFSSFQGQENNIKSSYGQSDPQPRHSQGLTLASYQAQETKAQSAARELSASPTQESAEISAPLSIMTALAEARKNKPMLPDGVLVTQNMDVTVCNSETVVQMFRCLRAEDAAFITSISNGLKCHFRYKRNWNADLLLWVEPFTLGDTAAFSGGHLFLRGWVQRNLGFGVVQPSFYWHEIQSTASFKYVATAPAPISETVSPTKSKSGNITSSTENLDSSTNISDPKADAVLVIRGDYIENVPCSRAALKNLAFSFVVDSSKEKVEQRLRCTFSLVEAKGPEKTGERELDLVVKRLLGTEKGEFEKATRFLRAWALRAIQSMPYKASVFLVSPEGLHILGQSPPPVMPANGAPGKRLDDPENTRSPYSALDLDLMLSEETAKVLLQLVLSVLNWQC